MSHASSPQVVKMSASVHINDLPDAKKIADQYGVEYEEDEDEKQQFIEEERVIAEMKESQQDNARLDKLVTKLDSKNKEIERLCVLLESVEMVPGVDPNKYLDVINGNDEEVDFRDTKIVHLAKKCRNLTVIVNKERSLKEKFEKKASILQDELDRTKRELDLVSTPAARAAARKGTGSKECGDDTPNRELKKELAQSVKQVDEWRKKALAAQDETKKLTRALAKEVGEGVTIDQAVDEGWKGRAQQIVMLKSKISRLEKDARSANSTNSRFRSSAPKGVDAKAEEELNNMSQDRKQAVEALTEDHARLSEECSNLTQKVERGKARVRALESDAAKHKTQIKVLVEKADSDDALIEALTEDLNNAKKKAEEYEKKYKDSVRDAANGTRPLRELVATKGPRGQQQIELNSGEDPSAELARLRMLCSQQGAQLETQETIIRQLRAKIKK